MEPEARFTVIGALLLALLLAAAAATVWLTRSGPRSDFRYYTIYFERQSLQGLQVGGDVEIRGVQVGRVERFAISRDNINRVQVTIRIDARNPVRTNTVAVIGRKILTGTARIDLVTPGAPGAQLTALAPGERYPVIGEGHSELEQITDVANRLAASGSSVLESVDRLLSPENRQALMATLDSIRHMADSIDHAARSAEGTTRQATATLQELAHAAAALERTTASIEHATEVGLHELRATAQELRSSAEIVARAADRIDNPRTAIFGPDPAQLGPGEKLQ
jgi:phospholipid/cholesterol/gamma-HCH transport system substrate-binding protein